MKLRRFLGAMAAMALFIGCSQEKQNAPTVASTTGNFAKETETAGPDVKKSPTADLTDKAEQNWANKDTPGSIASLEKLVAAEPKNRDALFTLSNLLEKKGMAAIQGGDTAAGSDPLLKAAKYMKQLRAAYPKLSNAEANELPNILYNEACVLALAGDADKSMAALEDACNSGFADFNLLSTDKDLDKLRSLASFKTWLESAKVKIAANVKVRVRQQIAAQKSFEFNFSLSDLDGKTLALKDYKGKVLIVDIWGTWCPPCRQEIPHFVNLLKKYESQGLRIVGINYENGEPAEAKKLIQDFAKANNMNYPCAIGDESIQKQVPNFAAFPTTLFIDRTGKVRLCEVGSQPPEALEAVIQALLEETTVSVK
jgi:thiol-disulfide isomerase/thioredoxin